jgi:hypothetical protein
MDAKTFDAIQPLLDQFADLVETLRREDKYD